MSPDGGVLYVACSGINALAVLDGVSGNVLGYIPTAWFPARVAVSPSGRTLYVACAKGFGVGPNGGEGFHPDPEGTYIGDITKGLVSIVGVPAPRELEETTAQVLRNNGFIGKPQGAALSTLRWSPTATGMEKISHVVFIVKENRTFDEVLGDLARQGKDIAGDPGLARWGESASVTEEGQPAIEDVQVTPNHHALARRFAFNDNYYVEADVSTDGHHWLVGNYPNEVVESTWPAAYGHKFHFRRVEFVFTNLRTDRVGGNARAKSESWVQGRVDGDAQICDLVIVGENAHIGGSTILCCDEIVGGESRRSLEAPRPAPSSSGASRFVRQTL